MKSSFFGYYRPSEGDNYLIKYPKLRRWVNTCSACGRVGYRPDMPKQIAGSHINVAAQTLRRIYAPLSVDENGLCEQCRSAVNKCVK